MFWRLCSQHETVNIINPKGHRIVVFASVEKRERKYSELTIKMTSGSVSKEREKILANSWPVHPQEQSQKQLRTHFSSSFLISCKKSSYWQSMRSSFYLFWTSMANIEIIMWSKVFFLGGQNKAENPEWTRLSSSQSENRNFSTSFCSLLERAN